MAVTRAQADTILIQRCGQLMTTCGMDGATITGTNANTVDPLRFALRKLGYTVASVTAVTDSDLAGCALTDEEALFDLAELRLLQNLESAATLLVDTSIGPRREQLGQIAAGISKMIAARIAAIQAAYGALLGQSIETGVIDLNFAEDGTNEY